VRGRDFLALSRTIATSLTRRLPANGERGHCRCSPRHPAKSLERRTRAGLSAAKPDCIRRLCARATDESASCGSSRMTQTRTPRLTATIGGISSIRSYNGGRCSRCERDRSWEGDHEISFARKIRSRVFHFSRRRGCQCRASRSRTGGGKVAGRDLCIGKMNDKGLKGPARKAEMAKCMAGPEAYQ
jgi:hypothetical protein